MGETIATCKLNRDLYELSESITSNNYALAIPTTIELNKADLWHLRLGHINQKRLRQIQTISKGIEPFDEKQITICQSCIEGKEHKVKFSKQGARRATEIFELIHLDICGPMQVPTDTSYLYFITFIDDLTRLCHVYLMKNKSKAFAKFQLYKSYVEKHTHNKLNMLRTDQGGEYLFDEFNSFCQEEGIKTGDDHSLHTTTKR